MRHIILLMPLLLFIYSIGFAAKFNTVLVTGGTGYIGSHVIVELLNEGYEVVSVDNLVNSSKTVNDRIKKITGKDKEFTFYQYDLRRTSLIKSIFQKHKIDAVIHLAGLKSVSESGKKPLKYFSNNLNSTLSLLKVMKKHHCHNLIFSSSATVYGKPQTLPLKEDHPFSATNPYGRTKIMIEQILNDVAHSSSLWRFISLRYFNPIGAHPSGEIGESPNGIPNNLMPYILLVLQGKQKWLNVFGDQYPTPDRTAKRDFIHVVDLALGHLAALHKLENEETFHGHSVNNLGTGTSYSVLELVNAINQNINSDPSLAEKLHLELPYHLPYKIASPRDGDVAEVYANPELARTELGWEATHDLREMIRDSLQWIIKNPDGYEVKENSTESKSSDSQ